VPHVGNAQASVIKIAQSFNNDIHTIVYENFYCVSDEFYLKKKGQTEKDPGELSQYSDGLRVGQPRFDSPQ
jgi:hypothetical protein